MKGWEADCAADGGLGLVGMGGGAGGAGWAGYVTHPGAENATLAAFCACICACANAACLLGTGLRLYLFDIR